MIHCVEYRQSVLDFCAKAGNSIRKASKAFGLSTNTIQKWKKLKASGNLAGNTFVRKQRKLDLDALKELLEKNPDLLQAEMAAHFGVNRTTIHKGLKKIGYKRKKKRLYTMKGTNKKDKYIWTK